MEPDDPIPPHDFLDDLESFFYVLCDLVFSRVSPGKEMDRKAKIMLERWDLRDDVTAKGSKGCFILYPFAVTLVDEDYWGSAFVELLEAFHDFLENLVRQKVKTRAKRGLSYDEKVQKVKDLGFDEHYNHLDRLFQTALDALKNEEPEIETRLAAAKAAADAAAPPPASTTRSATNPALAPIAPPVPRRASKRRMEQIDIAESSEPPPKRRSTRITRKVVPFVNWK